MQRGFTPIMILVGILVIVAIAGGAYYFGKSQSVKPIQTPQPTAFSQVTPIPSPSSVDETANWKTYTNAKYGFSIKYPSNAQFDSSPHIPVEWKSALATPSFMIFGSHVQGATGYGASEFLTIAIFSRNGNQQGIDFTGRKDVTKVQLGNYQADFYKTIRNQPSYYYQIISGNYIFQFLIDDYSQNVIPAAPQNSYQKMLSTFKFTQ